MTDKLEMFTVYRNPRDYPGLFVVRRWTISYLEPRPNPDAEPLIVCDTLEDARLAIHCHRPGLFRIDESNAGDPAVLEVWF